MRLERTYPNVEALNYTEFQFHKGAIRTAYAAQKYKEIQYFNSIKVRLEHCNVAVRVLDPAVFQFHKGAIRTR